jgi:hypothetical protein
MVNKKELVHILPIILVKKLINIGYSTWGSSKERRAREVSLITEKLMENISYILIN